MKTQKGLQDGVIASLRELQIVSERLLLVGIAIKLRKRLDKRLRSTRAHIDTEVHGQVGSPAGVMRAASFFWPASRS